MSSRQSHTLNLIAIEILFSGIHPGKLYSMESIKRAIKEGVGYDAYIECNVDTEGNHQIYQVYMCVDKSALNFTKCPVMPHGRGCGSHVEFPSLSDDSNSKYELWLPLQCLTIWL